MIGTEFYIIILFVVVPFVLYALGFISGLILGGE